MFSVAKDCAMLRELRRGFVMVFHAAAVVAVVFCGRGLAAGEPSIQRSTWNGYERLDFEVDGRKCVLGPPKTAAPGKPWIWRTEFFGHEPQADLALLGKGFHAAYMDVQNMYGAPAAMGHMDAFYAHLTSKHALE